MTDKISKTKYLPPFSMRFTHDERKALESAAAERPLSSAILNHHQGNRMIDGSAIRSYRVGLAASQFSSHYSEQGLALLAAQTRKTGLGDLGL